MLQFKRLFESGQIGSMRLKNRLVMLAMETGYTEHGEVSDRLKAFIEHRAKGGVGLIISPFAPVYGVGHLMTSIADDSFTDGLKEVADAVHKYNCKIAAQLIIMDEYTRNKGAKSEFVGPSDVAKRPGIPKPRPLSVEEIEYIVAMFGHAARRLKQAGFDAIEFHSGIGFLLNQFLSPLTNKRTDRYGGSLENRMRFLLDSVAAARKEAGKEFPIICRISADEFMDGGLTTKETTVIAKVLEDYGISALNVQAGWHESPRPLVQTSVIPGYFTYLAGEIKKAVKLPIITAYRINSPQVAEKVLESGEADYIGLARALIADPEFASKAERDKADEIRPCIACCHCLDMTFSNKPFSCSVNPYAGQEYIYPHKTAEKPKKVFVVGGGPAGVKAAVAMSELGHQVELWEKERHVGGQVNIAAIPPYKEELKRYAEYLDVRLKKSKVKVHLGEEASVRALISGKPDAVVLASGAVPLVPEIKGINSSNVITALEVLAGEKNTGERVVIIGGGMIGCETAEFLAQRGKKVTVLEMLKRLGGDIGITNRWVVIQRIKQAGVAQEVFTQAVEITPRGVKALKEGKEVFYEADTVVLAAGMKAFSPLYSGLKEAKLETYQIGDCATPARIFDATSAALRIAYQI